MRLRLLDVVWMDLYENIEFSLKLIKTTLCVAFFRCLYVFQCVLVDELRVLGVEIWLIWHYLCILEIKFLQMN